MTRLKKILKSIGPGFITGASDDDPSGIATYSQTGAKFGYSQLWISLFSLPFMIVVQEMCARIGIVTGKGLAGVIKTHYGKKLLFSIVLVLIIVNCVNIGADLAAMASSAQTLLGLPYLFWLLAFTVITLLLEIFVSYRSYAKVLKYFTFALFAYVITAFMVHQDWGKVFTSTFIPHITFSKDFLFSVVAVLGTTISPYLFFWQADEEVEEEVLHHKLRLTGKAVPKVSVHDISSMRTDTVIGMIFSNLVMFFVILTTASTLGIHSITDIQTADQAAQALKPFAGNFAFLLFSLGIIGTGMLAVPVLAGSASYAFAEAMNWKRGLFRKYSQARGFYGIIILSTCIGAALTFFGIPPFTMLYYAAVLNGLAAPILIFMIIRIGSNHGIMGKYQNKKISTIFGWIIFASMSIAGILLILSYL